MMAALLAVLTIGLFAIVLALWRLGTVVLELRAVVDSLAVRGGVYHTTHAWPPVTAEMLDDAEFETPR